MSKELQLQLQPGDQIIATEDVYFESGNYSQKVGDIIMVNNPKYAGIVGGTGLNGIAYNGRNCLGLGGSLKVGTFRRATPDDPGYMATREQWLSIENTEIRKLRLESFFYGVIAILSLGALAYVVMP
jgi:hypothetical protein